MLFLNELLVLLTCIIKKYVHANFSIIIMINNINCKNIHVSTLFSSFNIIIYILYLTGMGRPSVFWCYWQSDGVWRQSDENDFGKWFDDPRCFNDHIWCLVSQSFYEVLEMLFSVETGVTWYKVLCQTLCTQIRLSNISIKASFKQSLN